MSNRIAQNVSLTPELAAFIADRVASGRFGNASEVVRAGLRLLVEDERRREGSDRRAEAKELHLGR